MIKSTNTGTLVLEHVWQTCYQFQSKHLWHHFDILHIHVNLIHVICVILRMFSLSQAKLYTALSRKKSFQIFRSGSGTISQTIGSVPAGAS